ncbi:hypothetical protein PMAYCL1PPCAC_22666, partial [Pristionchus mayeri]
LLSALLFSTGETRSPRTQKQMEQLFNAEQPKTCNEIARFWCKVIMCNFEDKGGCKDKCKHYVDKDYSNVRASTSVGECSDKFTVDLHKTIYN